MPAEVINLDPEKLNQYGISAEISLLDDGVKYTLRETVNEALLSGDINNETFPVQLVDQIRTDINQVLAKLVADLKANWDAGHWMAGMEPGPEAYEDSDFYVLLRAISPELKDLEAWTQKELTVSDSFVGALQDRVREHVRKTTCFATLETHSKHPVVHSHLSLLREVAPLLEQKDLPGVIKLVSAAAGAPEYSLSADEVGHMYFIMFLPRHLRMVVSNLLIANLLCAEIVEEAEGLEENTPAWEMSQNLQHFLQLSAVNNGHFNQLITRYGLSESNWIELAAQNQAQMAAFKNIVQLGKNPEAKALLSVLTERLGTINDVIREVHKSEDSANSFWQSIDLGHGFGVYTFSEFHRITNDDHFPIKEVVKTGGKCVIFEDVPEQSVLWNDLTENFSPYSVSLNTPSAEAVLEAARDIDNHFFLLDIQQPGNPRAGIDLAKQVMKIRLGLIEAAREKGIEDIPKTHICMWTSNEEALEQAKVELNALQEALDPDERTISGFSSSGSFYRIALRGDLKNRDPFVNLW